MQTNRCFVTKEISMYISFSLLNKMFQLLFDILYYGIWKPYSKSSYDGKLFFLTLVMFLGIKSGQIDIVQYTIVIFWKSMRFSYLLVFNSNRWKQGNIEIYWTQQRQFRLTER